METVHAIVLLRDMKLPAIASLRLLRPYDRCYVLYLAIYISTAVMPLLNSQYEIHVCAASQEFDFASNTVVGLRSRTVIGKLANLVNLQMRGIQRAERSGRDTCDVSAVHVILSPTSARRP